MTEIEKILVMHGMLLCPLVLGHCAFLLCQRLRLPDLACCGDPRAVGDLVHFETLNSNYFLSMDPFPLGGRQPAPDGSGRVRVEKSK